MTDWLDAYASELQDQLQAGGTAVRVGHRARKTLLELARIVAHGTERRNAPLATYLAGYYAGRRDAGQGGGEDDALQEALSIAQRLLSRATD